MGAVPFELEVGAQISDRRVPLPTSVVMRKCQA
jgi:hypothetical protein